MRILLDENVPHPLMRFLSGHEVATVQGRGWRGILNGELLRIADESFDVFILADKNLRYQQNMDGRQIAIIELPTPRPVGSTRRRAPAPRSRLISTFQSFSLSAFQHFSISVTPLPLLFALSTRHQLLRLRRSLVAFHLSVAAVFRFS